MVVSTGLYALIRHPMYTGAILVFIGMPLALGSMVGLLSVPIFIAGFSWRLLHEETFLSKICRDMPNTCARLLSSRAVHLVSDAGSKCKGYSRKVWCPPN